MRRQYRAPRSGRNAPDRVPRRPDQPGPTAARAAADPKTEGPRPSSDVAIHRAVLLARPDVGAVVHAHLPASMALTLAGEVPDPASLPETALLLPRLPFVPFGAPGSADLAARIAAAFTDGEVPAGAVLLERHGAVAVGATTDGASGPRRGARTPAILAALSQAVDRIELVEVLCRTWRDALLLRAARSAIGPG
ncbi:MAG TPA: class II aldolase/adducin family protein [Candidatus Limnocylindrales bacterium]